MSGALTCIQQASDAMQRHLHNSADAEVALGAQERVGGRGAERRGRHTQHPSKASCSAVRPYTYEIRKAEFQGPALASHNRGSISIPSWLRTTGPALSC